MWWTSSLKLGFWDQKSMYEFKLNWNARKFGNPRKMVESSQNCIAAVTEMQIRFEGPLWAFFNLNMVISYWKVAIKNPRRHIQFQDTNLFFALRKNGVYKVKILESCLIWKKIILTLSKAICIKHYMMLSSILL